MNFLSIDTSTKYSVVSVSNEKGMIAGASRLFEKGRAEVLGSLIASCLKTSKLKMSAIDYFAAGTGPGSFTGLRIGTSTIKGLSYALAKPCIVFSSLDAIAFNNIACKCPHFCVIVDARRSNVYCRFYKSGMKITSQELLLSLPALLQKAGKGTAFCGDGIALYRKEIAQRLKGAEFMPQKSWYPTPESISTLTLTSFNEKKIVNCFELLPVYLYEQDCQIRAANEKK